MSDRKYQIFVSSTFNDLKDERIQLLFCILKLNYIPAGMEFFTAIDEEQMQYIQRVIDESDYYVLVMGARYGSMDSNGISYTEREYDYAVQQGKKVIALIHEDPDKIERGKTDKNEDLYQKFMAFRKKVIDGGRLVSFWNNTSELILNFQSSLIQTVQRFTTIGWMRGDVPANTETLQKIATLELENQRLKEHIKNIGGMQIATAIKMEACSATTPDVFSETEIECVSLDIATDTNTMIKAALVTPRKSYHSQDDIAEFYCKKAIPWFQKMARICRFDLRITNPNSFLVKNMDVEQHLYRPDGSEAKTSFQHDLIGSSPSNPNYDECSSMTGQMAPARDLNPKQSTLYTHHRCYIPSEDQTFIYQRIIFAENITDPIKKEIKIHYRVKKITMDVNQIIETIQDFENQKKFNDAGVYEFVTGILKQEKQEQTSCDTQK